MPTGSCGSSVCRATRQQTSAHRGTVKRCCWGGLARPFLLDKETVPELGCPILLARVWREDERDEPPSCGCRLARGRTRRRQRPCPCLSNKSTRASNTSGSSGRVALHSDTACSASSTRNLSSSSATISRTVRRLPAEFSSINCICLHTCRRSSWPQVGSIPRHAVEDPRIAIDGLQPASHSLRPLTSSFAPRMRATVAASSGAIRSGEFRHALLLQLSGDRGVMQFSTSSIICLSH